MENDAWNQAYQQLQSELVGEAKAANIVISLGSNFDEFEASLNRLYREYANKGFIMLVTRKLNPHFQHLKSFEKAIMAATSNSQIAGFVWGSIQLVLECVCRFSTHVSDIMDSLANFYKSFPIFEAYLDLYPEDTQLDTYLNLLYHDYGEFCIEVIRFTTKQPIRHVFNKIFSSKGSQKMREIKNSFAEHKAGFELACGIALARQVNSGASANPRGPQRLAKTSINTVLRRHTKYFRRQEILEDIHKSIRDSQSSSRPQPVSCVIHGMGGIGKTQMAVEYNFKYEKAYGCHIWIDAESPASLKESYERAAAKMFDKSPEPEKISKEVRDWLESTDWKWLLIFDNVEKWDDIKFLVPAVSKKDSVVLITSQIEDLKHLTTFHHEMRSLDAKSGADLLLSFVYWDTDPPESERDAASYLSAMFGGLPLALAHIGGFVSQKQGTLAGYKDQADRRFASTWKGKPATVQEYEKRLENVFDIALTELEMASSEARKLLDTMAFLNPDNMSEELLMTFFEISATDHGRQFAKDELEEMTPHLVRRGLVHREINEDDETSYSVHRTLQHALMVKLESDHAKLQEAFSNACKMVRLYMPETSSTQTPNEELWPQLGRAAPHIQRIRQIYMKHSFQTSQTGELEGNFQLARMFYDAGFHIWENRSQNSQEGVNFLEAAERVLKSLNTDTDGKLQANIHATITQLIDNQYGASRWAEIIERRRKARNIRKKILDIEIARHKMDPSQPIDRDTELLYYNAVNDDGISSLQWNMFEEAGSAFTLCYHQYQRWGDEKQYPFEYSKYFHNMAYVRMYQGDYNEAIRLAEIGVGLAGKGGRYCWFKFDLACIVLQSGDLQDALDIHLEVLEKRKDVCGEDSPFFFQSQYAVGAILHHLGRSKEAEKYLRECVKNGDTHGWLREPLARARLHLARVLRALNLQKFHDEINALEKKARELVADFLKLERPEYLRGNKDELAIFDNFQPAFNGRFTGILLLRYIQEYHLIDSVSISLHDSSITDS